VVVLALTGCGGWDEFMVRSRPVPVRPSFCESFDQEAMAEKYSAILKRICRPGGAGSSVGCGHGHDGSSATGLPSHEEKHFNCFDIEADANKLSEVLDDLMAAVRSQAEASGAVVGAPRFEIVRGALRRFEFNFKQGKDEVRVVGSITPVERAGKWDFRVKVERTFPPDA
jgi:hypothetical protein